MIDINAIWVGIITFSILFILILAGMRVCFAVMLVGLVTIYFFPNKPLVHAAVQVVWDQTNSFTLTAIPLFILMGEIMVRTGLTEDLYKAVEKWIPFLPGGLAHVNIVSSGIFAALSGSSVATVASIGKIAVPAMTARNYNVRLVCGSITGGGTLGILIPPSIVMIIYGSLADVSVGGLFIAGIVPGIMLLLAFMFYIFLWSLKSPSIAPALQEKFSWTEKLATLSSVIPCFFLILIILGGIYFGIVTPTEAAGVGAFSALIIAVLTMKFKLRVLTSSLKEAILATSMIMLIVAGAAILSWGFNLLQVPQTITEAILSLGWNRYFTLALVAIMYYVMGCFIDGISICIITIPVIYPVMMTLGFDPLWFGVFLTINIEVSLLTPPLGMNLYVLKGVNPGLRMQDIMIGALPYCFILTLGLVIFTIFPQIATWLPYQIMK